MAINTSNSWHSLHSAEDSLTSLNTMKDYLRFRINELKIMTDVKEFYLYLNVSIDTEFKHLNVNKELVIKKEKSYDISHTNDAVENFLDGLQSDVLEQFATSMKIKMIWFFKTKKTYQMVMSQLSGSKNIATHSDSQQEEWQIYYKYSVLNDEKKWKELTKEINKKF